MNEYELTKYEQGNEKEEIWQRIKYVKRKVVKQKMNK